jgi:hypothetical protein
VAEVKHTSMRIKPHVRALTEKVCGLEHRNLTNLVEAAILEYARARGISLDSTSAPAPRKAPETDWLACRPLSRRASHDH